MIKEHIKRKFIITTLALIIFIVTMSFPNTEEQIKNITISYSENINNNSVYILDSSLMVSRIDMRIDAKTNIDMAKEIIEILTIQSQKSTYIPSFFEPVIPKDTKILCIDMQDNVLKINFSKEFLNVANSYEEKMIECIVFSLTEIDSIEGIIIFVEGSLLEKVPNTSTPLPPILKRDIGVNKVYNLDSLKDVSKTTTYYIKKNDDFAYYVPVTLLQNTDKNKIEIIIERLKGSYTENTNLISYLNASTELSNYELLEQEVILSFSSLLYEGLASEEIKEEVKYSISLSMKDTLNVKEVTFLDEP